MKILNLEISNFKGIQHVRLEQITDTVVIAGPNGCGKSSILDAIRLLKPFYGASNGNEIQSWFNELQPEARTAEDRVKAILYDESKELEILVDFTIDPAAKDYLRENHRTLVESNIWNSKLPPDRRPPAGKKPIVTSDIQHYKADVEKELEEKSQQFLTELENEVFPAGIKIYPNGDSEYEPSYVLEVCFGLSDPNIIGFIDYHSASRSYKPEKLGGIQLNNESSGEKLRNHALFNVENKYQNIKTEMASAYIRELISEAQGQPSDSSKNLISTMQELFGIFFPGKKFLGPKPTESGTLAFPIELADGSIHDINQLSSGEKEIVYGYLRLKNTNPKNSILLFDEPELHLNPRLVSGLPKFYHKYLGSMNSNQLWLITHSDMILKESVGEPGFSVFHMKSSSSCHGEQQIRKVSADNELDSLLIDLIGPGYTPNSSVIIFEGGGDSDFDLNLVKKLFPDLVDKANLISGENKHKVTSIHHLLYKASESGSLPFNVFSIVDKDSEVTEERPNLFNWDVYHIENYLLHPGYIRIVSNELTGDDITEDDVKDIMYDCAACSIDYLVQHKLKEKINRDLISCINLNFDPKAKNYSEQLGEAVIRSQSRIEETINQKLSPDRIKSLEQDIVAKLTREHESGQWYETFVGRMVLKDVSNRLGNGVSYEIFRNLIIARMKQDNYKPEGMQKVLDKIIQNC